MSQTATPLDRLCGPLARGNGRDTDRASEAQLAGIQAISGGAAGGWPATFAQLIGDFHLHKAKISSKHIPFEWSGPDA